jgi:hypothetical protein
MYNKYQFIKILYPIPPVISQPGYLYQDMTTNKYYLSYTDIHEYMLIENMPILKLASFKNTIIDIVTEVTPLDFIVGKINNYKL